MIKIPIRQQDGSIIEIEVKATGGMKRLAAWVKVKEKNNA